MHWTSQIDWYITDVKLISLPRPIQTTPPSNIIHHSFFPFSLSICLYRSERVRGAEQDSCQTCPQWVKMAGEVLFFFFPLSCSLGSKLKTCPRTASSLKFCDVILSEQRKDWKQQALFSICVVERLAHAITHEWDDHEGPLHGHRPLLPSRWHLHSLSLCSSISHAALSSTINLYWSYFQSKGMHKGSNVCFFCFALCLLQMCCLKLQRTLGHVSTKKGEKKEEIRQNKQCLAAFFLWQTTAAQNGK